MSHFKAKMNKIQLQLGLCPRPRWGSLQCFPDPLAGYKVLTSKGREDRKGRKWKGVEGKGGKGRR